MLALTGKHRTRRASTSCSQSQPGHNRGGNPLIPTPKPVQRNRANSLAAVAAGITMSYVELSGQAMASTRVRRSVVWDAVQFALNGVIFVLWGEQLPGIVAGASETLAAGGEQWPWQIALYAIAIMLVLVVLRFIWVWASLRFTIFRTISRSANAPKPNFRLVTAISLAGVRGAITLAGVMTLPLVLGDGAPFPARDLATLLAVYAAE